MSRSGVQSRYVWVSCGKFGCTLDTKINTNILSSACLPVLRLLLVKLFPILGGSSARSRNKYYNYGSGNELHNVGPNSQSKRSHCKSGTAVSSPRSGVFDVGDGITVKTSYTVQRSHGDTDEASLVSHEEKNKLPSRS
jgi:hypothetical protein